MFSFRLLAPDKARARCHSPRLSFFFINKVKEMSSDRASVELFEQLIRNKEEAAAPLIFAARVIIQLEAPIFPRSSCELPFSIEHRRPTSGKPKSQPSFCRVPLLRPVETYPLTFVVPVIMGSMRTGSTSTVSHKKYQNQILH